MTNFTPVASFIGGVLIGLSAAAMLLLNGKIAGISGILAGVLRPVKADTLWRACFLAGLLTGGLMLRAYLPQAFDFGTIRSPGALTVAGLLVGFGTRLGNGCTSGHGICGTARLSGRSIAATATFMVAGAAVVYAVNHLLRGSL
ncbi:MAG TPA: YeeE/YedE thiosulfate transporter family protein [Candidatus Binataceae bacterium]|nr:YeeE/YedE thiosulfate transporter family protein [Candidatus Binataceae bacterium]